ncbi:hypothetical protein ACJIZ3_003094 [Penstemon smallii]|uniref:GST N-terminal domain-containing protein n=1 Tax=Penstemon smallii TaxID=265156 RepID=A0ABD3U8B7_9LAMI
MHSTAIPSPNPSFTFCYHKYDSRIQPFLINFNPSTSARVVPNRNYHKNVLAYRNRNRFQVRNSVNQENEDVGNVKSSNSSSSLLSFLCPLLKLFSAGDPSGERNYLLEEATSSLSSLARFPWGSRSLDGSTNQKKELSTEACPFCRRVREAITELDLSVEIFPCPKGSLRHRAMVNNLGGREQFPFLIDPNTGVSMYESDIVKYLFRQYGGERSPSFARWSRDGCQPYLEQAEE